MNIIKGIFLHVNSRLTTDTSHELTTANQETTKKIYTASHEWNDTTKCFVSYVTCLLSQKKHSKIK